MLKKIYNPGSLMLPVLNVLVRAISLAGRFGLSLYLAKYLTLADLGMFGLITGVTNMMPSLAGWGLSYFVNREIIDKSKLVSGRLIRDRLAVTFVSLAVLLAVAAPFVIGFHVLPNATLALLALAIIILECVLFDLHGALVSLGHPLAANTLLFVRSALWVFPAAIIGILYPEHRTLAFVFSWWLGGLLTSFVAMIWVLRGWPMGRIMTMPVDMKWMLKTIRRGWLVYLSDLGIIGTMFLDRYVVDHFLGLSSTGVFTLYWSVANSMYLLVDTGIIQILYPKLVAVFNRGDLASGRKLVRGMRIKAVCMGVGLAAVTGLCFPPVLTLMGKADIAAQAPVFWVILAGVCVRILGDSIDIELTCRRLDKPWALINMGGIALAFVFSVVSIRAMGLVGAGVSVIVTHSCLIAMRLWVLKTAKPTQGGGDLLRPSFDAAEEI
ncbi:MAG: hypothetical protein P4M15_11705 [Alphaproteobacteria bacterium]|nr:hypothetical protein [Alphaproteobacteria bacterium]